jgi:hypothetical protein
MALFPEQSHVGWLYSQNKAMWVGFIPSAVLVLSGAPLQEETQILFGTPCLYK